MFVWRLGYISAAAAFDRYPVDSKRAAGSNVLAKTDGGRSEMTIAVSRVVASVRRDPGMTDLLETELVRSVEVRRDRVERKISVEDVSDDRKA